MRVVAASLQRATHPRPSLLVRLRDEAGRTGVGECSPLPPFSRDDVAACERALSGVHHHLAAVDDAASPTAQVALALSPLGRALDAVPAARFALETALFDLLGQRLGLSVAACLGGPAAYARVPVNALLLAPPLDTLAERAAALASAGFSALKIKLRARDDEGFARELTALREVRARLPLPFELRLDPNAAWTEDVARRRLEALGSIAPRFVEQPVAADRLHLLGACAVPWAADESLVYPDLIEPLLASAGCAAFVLKPPVLGGLLRARALARLAQSRGIGVVVTHFFDGPHALAAACELALSLPAPPLACGLAPHDQLDAWCAAFGVVDVPQLAEPGQVLSSGGPGLGVSNPSPEHAWTT